jgi:hypothetical protein
MPRTRGFKCFYKIYYRIYCGEGASCPGNRRVKYFYKVCCRIYWGQGASCHGYKGDKYFYKLCWKIHVPRLRGLYIFIKFIAEYIVEEGFHAPN